MVSEQEQRILSASTCPLFSGAASPRDYRIEDNGRIGQTKEHRFCIFHVHFEHVAVPGQPW